MNRENSFGNALSMPQHFAPDVFNNRLGGWSLEMIQERDREKERFAKEVLHLQYIFGLQKIGTGLIRKEIIGKLACYPFRWCGIGKRSDRTQIPQWYCRWWTIQTRIHSETDWWKLQVHLLQSAKNWKRLRRTVCLMEDVQKLEQAEQNRQHKQEKEFDIWNRKWLQDQKKYLEKCSTNRMRTKSNSRSGICNRTGVSTDPKCWVLT